MSTDYERRLIERCEAWRTKHPDRAAGLRVVTARLLGGQGFLTRSGPTATAWIVEMLRPTENEIIRLMQGWPPAPPRAELDPDVQGVVPPAVSHEITGRDRALPAGDQ